MEAKKIEGKEFEVHYSFYLSDAITVKASTEEEARAKVKEMISKGEIAADLNDMEVGEQKVWVD